MYTVVDDACMTFEFFFVCLFFQRTDTLSRKKMLHTKTLLAAVYDCITSHNIIVIYYACTYNVDDLYHIEWIDPPDMVKIVYIIGTYYIMRTPDIYTCLLHSRKAWAANIAIEWLPCRSI